MTIQLPPQPKLEDFETTDDGVAYNSYRNALEAWERVCKLIIESQPHTGIYCPQCGDVLANESWPDEIR